MSANVTSFKYSTEESAEILRRHIQEHSMGVYLTTKDFKHTTEESAEILRHHIQKHSIYGGHGVDLTSKDFKHSTKESSEILRRHIQTHTFSKASPPKRKLRRPECACLRPAKWAQIARAIPPHDSSRPQRYAYTEPQVPDPIWESIEKQIREENGRCVEAKAEPYEPKVPNHIDYSPAELQYIQATTCVNFNGKRLPLKVQSCIWPSTDEGKAWQQRQYLMREVREVGGYPVSTNQMEIEEYILVEPPAVLKGEEISEEKTETKVGGRGIDGLVGGEIGSWEVLGEDMDAEMYEAEGF